VSLNTGSAGGDFVLASSGGNVNALTVTANAVALSAPGSVTAGTLNVGAELDLAGASVSANVNGGAQIVSGTVTGSNGGIASTVNLTLSSPSGFAFDNFWASAASVNLPLGSFSIGSALIVDQATFVNPLTAVLVDQHTRSIQRSDVQLYSSGAPFSFGLNQNHVYTDAFVIYRSPLHDVISPSGQNSSSVEQSEDALSKIISTRPAPELQMGGGEGGALITYTGVPVALGGECDPDLDPECRK
jgi:hypothetical protein